MEVVHVQDMRHADEMGAHVTQVKVIRGGLEEDLARFAEQAPRRAGHKGDHEQRSNGVGAFHPVSTITTPAMAVPTKAYRSVRMCV